jgi:hypothetical protein
MKYFSKVYEASRTALSENNKTKSDVLIHFIKSSVVPTGKAILFFQIRG